MMKNAELAKKIKQLRIRKRYSQEELANLTGLSLRTVQRIENGETEPRGDSLQRLASALEVTADELIDWPEQEDSGFLVFLNLSALSFVAFPLLGIIIPFAIWMTKKDKIRYINDTGKKIVNFQVTWCILLFIFYIFFFGLSFLHIHLRMSFMGLGTPETFLLFNVAMYLGNIVLILFNTYRTYKEKKVLYQPAIPMLR